MGPVKVGDSVMKTVVTSEATPSDIDGEEAEEVSVICAVEDGVTVVESIGLSEPVGFMAVAVGRGAESVMMLSVA